MPAKIITVKAKSKKELQQKSMAKIREAAKGGFGYIAQGYRDSRVKRVKGGYEIEITVHT